MSSPEEESRLLSAILEQMAEGVLVADPEGQFKFFNAQAETLLGGRPSLKPEEWSEYFRTHYLDSEGELRPARFDEVPMYRALRGQSVDAEEYLVRHHPDHSGVWLRISSRPLRDSNGESFGAVSVCRDITALKLAEAENRRVNGDFRRVIETSRDGIGIHRAGSWIFVNAALVHMFGCSAPDQLLGVALAETVDPESASYLCCPEGEGLSPVKEIALRRQIDGRQIAVEVSPARLAEFEGDAAVLVVFRDLSERKKMESQLMLSDRMASIGTLATGVGHEITSPLTVASLNLEMVLQNPEALRCPEAKAMLEEALAAARGAARIVTDLRKLAHHRGKKPGPVDLHALLDSTAQLLSNELHARTTLVKSYEPDLPPVLGIESSIGQLILNLMKNGIDAIPEGSRERNTLTLATRRRGRFVELEVGDTGEGVPPAVARQMFTPFFTTKPPGSGTGLGLFLCHRIVTEMGGTISFASEQGKGTSFTVTLPATEFLEKERETPRFTREPFQGGTILVVDDEPSLCKCLKRMLSRRYDVQTCHDGHQALEILRKRPFDLVLCDVLMPNMNGVELLKVLQVQFPEQAERLIFLTGGAFTHVVGSFLENVSNPILKKPCEFKELLSTVSAQIERGRA